MVVTSAQGLDKVWYPDSRATNHFSHGTPPVYATHIYSGSSKVQVVNCSFLDKSKIGTYVVNTSSKPLVLHNIIYNP